MQTLRDRGRQSLDTQHTHRQAGMPRASQDGHDNEQPSPLPQRVSDNTWCSLPSPANSSLVPRSSLTSAEVPLAISDLQQTSLWDADLVHPVYVTRPSFNSLHQMARKNCSVALRVCALIAQPNSLRSNSLLNREVESGRTAASLYTAVVLVSSLSSMAVAQILWQSEAPKREMILLCPGSGS